ncbi:cation eflux system protein [Cytophaga hutchinsonii ATCC 33406]|uniref:Cation eflux system protein n=2 Tax=Cytophaga hutchinsonii TaxID=985 RepID=A0A6N4SP69_CYTH3|nr:cation eflux system protein [Cytophaga hutchinsonii ATCC 33406]SFX13886.1 membrane fusion protein, cobalt-zinc-cadmium efflux system [Cytophaga hutchinsonii ATCC 33406]
MNLNNKMNCFVLLLVFAGLLGTSCSDEKKSIAEPIDTNCLSDSMLKLIEFDTIQYKQVTTRLLLSGKITENEDKLVKVYPLVGGYVKDLRVELGDYVNKGDVLAVIQSTEVADFQNQLVIAESNLNIAEKNLQVTQDMFEGGLSSEKDLVVAKKEYQKAVGELRRIKEVMNIYGVGEFSAYTVKAPISGFITEKFINENMQFRMDNTEQLFTIANLDNVWVIANVFESDIDHVKEGSEVEVTTLSYPDQVYKGRVDKIFNVLDKSSRVMKVRIILDNKGYKLKPEMFASISLLSQSGVKSLIAPENSLIFDNNKDYVLVYKDACHIDIRAIERIDKIDNNVRIQSGLKEGERVITKHQLLIYNHLINR